MNAVVYIFQVSACMGIFYLFYYLLLSRYTFFTINRWYLIVTLALCFVIPLLTITVQHQDSYPQVLQKVVYINQMQIPQQVIVANALPAVQEQFNWMAILKATYTVAVTALLIRLLLMIVKFFSRLKNKRRTTIGRVHIVQGDEQLSNGSFFNYIFLNDNELTAAELEQIIAHEMLHVKLYHSVDRILVKIAQVFLWFNPFVYLYARAIEENHEFEVDRAISNSTDKNTYAELLFHLSVARQGTLYHNFSMVPLKKRVTMLFTKPTNRMKRIIYLLVVPVVLISCLAFAKLKKETSNSTKKSVALDMDDTAKIKSRQRTKRNAAQILADEQTRARMIAYMETPEGKKNMDLARSITSKTIGVIVLDNYLNKAGKLKGKWVKDKVKGDKFVLLTGYGQEKQLNNQIKKGDIIDITVFFAAAGITEPLTITPGQVVKDGKKIFQLAEAAEIPDYPFQYEPNKVRFADGQISNITKYANGKWKTAVFERVNGYKFNLTFKPGAPDLNSIKWGDHVRLRFVHEIQTSEKLFKINDWVSISTDIKNYGIKNPEWFGKYYKVVKADTGKVSAINGIEKLGANPLILIDGKAYNKGILYKISLGGVNRTSIYTPNDGATKYGEKARDGAVIIETRDGKINYLTTAERRNLVKLEAAKGKFFSRVTLTKEDGSKYDVARITRANGSGAAANVETNGKIAFIINNKLYNETQFKRLFKTDNASYGPSIGVGGGSTELTNRGFNLKGYDLIFEFDPGSKFKLQGTPLKTGAILPGKKPDNNQSAIIASAAIRQGLDVRSDGSLWFNNQRVNKANINGKTYEGANIGSAAHAIPADLIEKFNINNTPPANDSPKPNSAPEVLKNDLINSVPKLKSGYKNVNDSLIAARFPGKVIKVADVQGTRLVIVKNDNYYAAYSHLKNANVSEGQELKLGGVIGSVVASTLDQNDLAEMFQLYRGSNLIQNKQEQEVIIRDLGQQRLNMRLKLGEVYAFKQ